MKYAGWTRWKLTTMLWLYEGKLILNKKQTVTIFLFIHLKQFYLFFVWLNLYFASGDSSGIIEQRRNEIYDFVLH